MKLLKIWEKLNKQRLSNIKDTDAIVYVGDDQYLITKVKYDSGRCIGFDAVQISCGTCKNNVEFPPPHTCDVCTSLDTDDYYMWKPK